MSNISSNLRCGFHATFSSIIHSKAHYAQFWFAFSIYYVSPLSCWSKVRSWGSCGTWDLVFQIVALLHVKFSQKWFASPSLSHCRDQLWKCKMDLRVWNEAELALKRCHVSWILSSFFLLPLMCKIQRCGVCLLILFLLQNFLPKLSEEGQIQGRSLMCNSGMVLPAGSAFVAIILKGCILNI